MAFELSINSIDASKYVSGLQPDIVYRARSVKYALDGTAWEDRLGSGKKALKITFSDCPQSVWENLKTNLNLKFFPVNVSAGAISISGNFRLADNSIPTPIMVLHEDTYYCSTFSIKLEQI